MNNIQEEICNVVEAAGITLNGANESQMLAALLAIIGRGGTQSEQAILNNQSSNVNLTGIIFNKDNIKGAKILFDIFRRTDTQNVNETGEIFVSYNTETGSWAIAWASHGDDAGITFQIGATGQVSYQSSDLTGASYSGEIKLTNIITLAA